MDSKENKENVNLEDAQKCISSFLSAKLFLHSQKQDYIRKTSSANTGSTVAQQQNTDDISNVQNEVGEEDISDPNIVESDLKYFKELFSKLKFSYIEQETKERYLRAILDDPILVVEHKDNIELEKKNVELKSHLKSRKEDVDKTCKELEQTVSKVCNDYETTIQQAIEADHMLKEIEKMEKEIEELKDNEKNQEQNLPLKDSLSLLSSQTKKASKLKKDIDQFQAVYEHKKEQLKETIDEVKKRENEKQCCEAFAKEAIHTRQLSTMNEKYKKEQSGLWYQSLLDLQTTLLQIKNFRYDNSQERIDLTLKTRKGHLPIHLFFKNGLFHDACVDLNIDIEKTLSQAKQPRYLVFQIFYEDQLISSLTGTVRPKKASASNSRLPDGASIILKPSDLSNIIKEHVHLNFGDWGHGLVASSLNIKYYSPATCMGILRIARQHYRLVWAALTLVKMVHNQRVVIRVLRVNGTMKSAEMYLIEHNRDLLLQHKSM
ncbi:hypothetical protein PMAC_001409 [Pneumocystis sp. 'macacae']|nr:hypothetical protein PMAC_001409 [Pneumocystis sp. 'macacae']